ncbi:MAG TPA: twin-arginine translocase TatA/TatE family subunit [Gammaproteobacteria bacterium]|nr:twin-arginine translocase TatA/TatE family subunit [Gammaproteobacteria bacterium]
MFGGFGIPELLIVLVIVLVFFGAGKLPEIGSALGKGIRGFRNSMNDGNSDQEGQDQGKTDSLEHNKGETIEGHTVEQKDEEKK